MNFLKLVSGDVILEFGDEFDNKQAHKLAFIEIQLAIIRAIEEYYTKEKSPGWALVGTLFVNNKEVGLIPILPYLADAGGAAHKDLKFLEAGLAASDLSVKVIYHLVLEHYNKNANKILT